MPWLLLVLAVLLTAPAWSRTDSPMPEIKIETVALGGRSALSVRSDVRGAEVWVDYIRRGTVPVDLTGLSAGAHVLILRQEGYDDNHILLNLAADTRTTVTASLRLKTGFLQLSTVPQDATVVVDGQEYAAGIIELPIGKRLLTIKAFGYRQTTLQVVVPERQLIQADVSLEPASFEVSDIHFSTRRFNPRNSGLKGVLDIQFSVTAPGRAELTILGPDNNLVAALRSSTFVDWQQSMSWNGRDQRLDHVPDGSYTIRLQCIPQEGIASSRDTWLHEDTVRIDSTMVLTPRGLHGPIPGAIWAPEAFAPANSTLSIGFTGSAYGSLGSAPAGSASIGLGLSLEGLLDLGFAAEAGLADAAGAALAGLRIAVPFDPTWPLGLSVQAIGRLSAATASNPSWLRAGLSLGLGNRFINITLAPDIGGYWADSFETRAGLGAAFNLSGYSVGMALSARMESAGHATGLAAVWPLRTGLELRLLPQGLPIALRLSGGLDFAPLLTAWSAGIAISGGF